MGTQFEKRGGGYDWVVVFRNISDKEEIIDGTVFGVPTFTALAQQAHTDLSLSPDEWEVIKAEIIDAA